MTYPDHIDTSEPISTCPVCYQDVMAAEEHVKTPIFEDEPFMHTACVPDHMADQLVKPLQPPILLRRAKASCSRR